MFKTALLASVAVADMQFGGTVPGVDGTFPDVAAQGDSITLEQYSGANENFNFDFSQTNASPDPPVAGTPVNFTLAGLPLHPMTVSKIKVKAWMYKTLVYNQDTAPVVADMHPGTIWSQTIPFDVPADAPKTEYDVQVCGLDAANNDAELFCMRTAFKFY